MIKTIGIIGLGKMGHSIAKKLISSNFNVLGFDKNQALLSSFVNIGGSIANLNQMAHSADLIWLMLPAGKVIDDIISELLPNLKEGSIVVDGGNSFYKDSIRRYKNLAQKNIYYIDCGTSGGLQGEQLGFSLMIGGNFDVYNKCISVFQAIAYANGCAYVGPSGSGHYVKMVHNGIEYALLQSYAEGMQLLKEGYYENLDLEIISNVWQNGSIIRSWILELTSEVLKQDQNLYNISGKIGGGQTGNWTSETAREFGVNIPMINESLKIRKWSQKSGGNYATKLVAMLRNKFGGHSYETIE